MAMAGRVKNNAIYSGFFTCSGRLSQVAVKRAAGTTTVFLFSYDSLRQTRAIGGISGRSVTVSAPAQKMRCRSGSARFYLTAEGTNTRPQMTDRVPNHGKARA
jgi:hypothetical protein